MSRHGPIFEPVVGVRRLSSRVIIQETARDLDVGFVGNVDVRSMVRAQGETPLFTVHWITLKGVHSLSGQDWTDDGVFDVKSSSPVRSWLHCGKFNKIVEM